MNPTNLQSNTPETSTEVVTPKAKSPFLFLLFGAFITLIIGISGGFYLSNYLNKTENQTSAPTQAPTIIPTATFLQDTTLQTYTNNEVGFNFKYPSSIFITDDLESSTDSLITISVLIEKIADLPNEPFPYKTWAQEEQISLSNGVYGEDHSASHTYLRNVIPLASSINAKSFVMTGGITCEAVFFNRMLIFYKNGYQVYINVIADEEEIKKEYPQYFIDGGGDCGAPGIMIWKKDNTFIEDLTNKKISGTLKDWFDSYDQIVSSITFDQ